MATQFYVDSGGWLEYAHGMYQQWCEHCVLEAQLDHARARAAAIPELEAKLAACKCEPTTAEDQLLHAIFDPRERDDGKSD